MLRCNSHSSMHLYFNAVKETAKVAVGASCSSDDGKDEQVSVSSSLVITLHEYSHAIYSGVSQLIVDL